MLYIKQLSVIIIYFILGARLMCSFHLAYGACAKLTLSTSYFLLKPALRTVLSFHSFIKMSKHLKARKKIVQSNKSQQKSRKSKVN